MVAQYIVDSDTCSTDGVIYHDDEIVHSEWIDGKEPDPFTCQRRSYNGIIIDGGYDRSICSGEQMYIDFGADTIPGVEYYAEKQYFEQLAQEQGVDIENGEVLETPFVIDYGGWNPQEQLLYDAEKYYSEDQPTHDLSTWQDRGIKEPEVSDAYDNSDSTTNIDAWTIANAGASNADVTSNDDSGKKSIFDGGFAGICESDQTWQWEEDFQDWRCSGNIPWDQAYTLTSAGDKVGLIVMPYSAYEPEDLTGSWNEEGDWSHVPDNFMSYHEAHWFAHGEESSLQSMYAKCWAGDATEETEQEAEDAGNYFEHDNIDVGTDSPWGIYGELDTSDTGGEFTCYWEYESDSSVIPQPVEGLGTIHGLDSELANNYEEEYEAEETIRDAREAFEDAVPGLERNYDDESSFIDQMNEWNIPEGTTA